MELEPASSSRAAAMKSWQSTWEGTEVCDWLTPRGFTRIVVKYRVPETALYESRAPYPNRAVPDSPAALEDALGAIRIVRACE